MTKEEEQPGLTKYVMRGVLFLLPIAVTLLIIRFAVGLSQDWWFGELARFLVQLVLPTTWMPAWLTNVVVGTLSLVLLVGFVCLLGMIASWPFGNQKLRLIDLVFGIIPGVRSVYSAVRKMVDAMDNSNKKPSFQRAVLVQSPWGPGHGTMVLAFVTKQLSDKYTGRKLLGILIPTPPNPFSGIPAIVPADEVVDPGLSMGEAIQAVGSFGVLLPDELTITPPPPNEATTIPGGIA